MLISVMTVGMIANGLMAQASRVRVCIVEGGRLGEIEADYHAATGDTTVAGKPFSSVYPPGEGYAAGEPWYIQNEPIEIAGTGYVKFGLPRVLGVTEISRAGEHAGVAVFAEAGTSGVPDIVYVPVRPGCEFQPYQIEIEEVRVVDAAPTRISLPQVVSGVLDSADPLESDDAYYEDYVFSGRAGERVVVEMRAPEMDTYLTLGRLVDRELFVLERNDDGFDSGTDSRIVLVLPETGDYAIRVSTLLGGEVGAYTLSLQGEGIAGGAERAASIAPGQSISGRLDTTDPRLADDSHYDEYRMSVESGQRLVITMRSGDFDTYVSIGSRSADGAFTELESNDDGIGNGTDSRIEMLFDAGGEYVIRANSYSGGEIGSYTLSVEAH